MSSVTIQFYEVSEIFKDDNDAKGMIGSKNKKLIKSFFRMRKSDSNFCRNAGAAQLYKKINNNPYREDGEEEYEPFNINGKYKEYNCISEGTKFGNFTSYGHTERLLMRDILDDLISSEEYSSYSIRAPSDLRLSGLSEIEWQKKILENLAKEKVQNKYKLFLEREGFIVKMWSERAPCAFDTSNYFAELEGGFCSWFVDNIFPKGSQFGYIVKDAQEVFREFKLAYEDHKDRRKMRHVYNDKV